MGYGIRMYRGLICLFLSLYGILYRFVDDIHVEQEGPVLQIPDVALYTALHLPELFGLAPEAGNLRPSRDSRFYEVPYHVLVYQLGVFLGMLQHVGAWTYHGHLPQENVDELGQFVDAGLAEEVAQPCLTGIVCGCLYFVAVFVDTHGTELVAPELPAVFSTPLLLEEDGAGGGGLDGGAYYQIDKGKQGAKEKSREDKVE